MKVAINGCGIAGPTLAWWLKKYGHEPVIYETAPVLRRGGYVIDFWGTGYDIADEMGLLEGLKRDAYFIEHVRTVTSGGWTTSSMSTKAFRDLTNGRYLSIARSDLARHIFDACEGIETRFGSSITSLEDRGDKVSIGLSDGGAEDYDLIVGADGLHSSIRSLVFGPQAQFEHQIGLQVAAFILPGYQPRDELAYVSHTKPGRQVSRVALRDDLTLFLFVFSQDFIEDQPVNQVEEKGLLKEIFADMGWETSAILSRMDDVEEVYYDRVSQIRMPDWSKGRVALVGDAAACVSLLAGEGTGLAMTEAYVLAGELHRTSDGQGASGGQKVSDGHRAAFRAYQDRLQPYLEGKQDAALGFAGFFAPNNWFQLVVRDVLLNLTGVPVLGKKLLAGAFKADVELPDYQGVRLPE